MVVLPGDDARRSARVQIPRLGSLARLAHPAHGVPRSNVRQRHHSSQHRAAKLRVLRLTQPQDGRTAFRLDLGNRLDDVGGNTEPHELNSDGVLSRAPRLAWTVAAVVVISYCASALLSVIVSGANGWKISIASVCLLALAVLHMSFFSRRLSWTPSLTVVALVVEGGLVYLPLPLYGASWAG